MSTLNYSVVPNNPSDCFTTINANHGATGSPARMSDGRIMTDYRPRCFQYPLAASQTWGENGARQRMIHGAEELKNAARHMNNRKILATSCVDTMVPELYKRVCTWQGCKTIPGNFQGIGTGRMYVASAVNSASNPQALSDASVPAIPMTFPREPPSVGSQCSRNDTETAWSVKGDVARLGGSAKSHPYSAPRS